MSESRKARGALASVLSRMTVQAWWISCVMSVQHVQLADGGKCASLQSLASQGAQRVV